MNKNQNTKKTLRGSLAALFLCVVMLIGTTFAWFTDSVSSGTNVIKAGNLDVKLEYSKDGGANWTEVTKDTDDLFGKDTLWEPGHVEYVNLKVSNLGSLALKYQLGVNITDEDSRTNVNGDRFKLSDYLQFAVVDGTKAYSSDSAGRNQALEDAQKATPMKLSAGYMSDEKQLLATETPTSDEVTLIVYMPEDVGNEANTKPGKTAPSIEFGVNLTATQVPYESDSFGNDYDQNATLNFKHVSTYDDIYSHLEDGKTYVVSGDVTGIMGKSSAFYFNKCDTTLQLSGSTIIAPKIKENSSTKDVAAISVTKGKNETKPAKLTIIGSGTVDGGSGAEGTNAAVKVQNGATVVIKGGTYTTGADAAGNGNSVVLANGGHVEIYDGFFYTNTTANGLYWVLNCQDNTDSSIKVYGGTFVNFNPADNESDGPNTKYVADGYKVVSEAQANGDIWYTVVKIS